MKRIMLFITAAVTAVAAGVALTPREAFVNAPRQVITAIDSITRLDMLDYYDSGSEGASRNAFGGEARVKLLNDELITVGTTKSSDVTIALLPAGRDTMLLVVNTLALPAPDSYATVYNRDWQPVAPSRQLPGHNDLNLWIDGSTKAPMQDIENAIPFIPAIYTYSDGTLTVSHSLRRLLNDNDYDLVKPYLRQSVGYRWDGGKWKKLK